MELHYRFLKIYIKNQPFYKDMTIHSNQVIKNMGLTRQIWAESGQLFANRQKLLYKLEASNCRD